MDIEGNNSGEANRPSQDFPVTELPCRFRYILRSLLIATLVTCVSFAALVPSFQYMRRLAQRRQCVSNLKQIALALHNYRDVHKAFPWASRTAMMALPCTAGESPSCPIMVAERFYDRYEFPADVEWTE